MNKVALVTGGSKSIGYAIGREIVKRIPSATCFMTSRENVSDYYSVILGLELGAGVRHRARFLQMDIRDEEEVSRHRDLILEQHGGLDILVNNAGHLARDSFSTVTLATLDTRSLDRVYKR